MKLGTTLRASQFPRPARCIARIRLALGSKPLRRAFPFVFSLAAAGVLSLSLGCSYYNPYLGASPTVSSTISYITPNGATAGQTNPISLTVAGSGFVAGSNVTWSGSGGSATNLPNSNFVNGSEMQATIPASFLANAGTFSIGVIAPGPTSGNNAGNNISNFVPFIVYSQSSPSVAPRTSTTPDPSASRPSGPIQTAPRFQAIVADSADASIQTGTGTAGIFLRDSCLGAAAACAPQIVPISIGWDRGDPNGPSGSPSATNDGRFVLFASEATNLVKGDSNGWSDIFLRDTCIGAAPACVPATTRLSIGPDGAEANGASFSPAISPDGRFVVFNSWATNLVRPDSLNSSPATSAPPLFLRDTCFGAASGCVPATSRVIQASALQH